MPLVCNDECESVSHVLWDCPVYITNIIIYKLPRDGLEV